MITESDNPFHPAYRDRTDDELIAASNGGSRAALEALIRRHQPFIYNLVLRVLPEPALAADATQEILIKVITKVGQFNQRSAFRTWLYRIVVNHIVDMRRSRREQASVNFEELAGILDTLPSTEMTDLELLEQREAIEETKQHCLTGMLLCLTREQRLVFVIGEIFKADHVLASGVLGISEDNYRQQLTRARKDLFQFLQQKCGLVNPDNPCRCHKKTKAFIAQGWVDPKAFVFKAPYLQQVRQLVAQKSETVNDVMDNTFQVFRRAPFYSRDDASALLQRLLAADDTKDVFSI